MPVGVFKRIYRRMPVLGELRVLGQSVERLHRMLARAALLNLAALMAQDPRYADPKRLMRYGAQTFSQNGEDGIVDEIFRRIGVASRRFVEIGVGNGLENNTALLLAQGWSGWWVEGDRRSVTEIRATFRKQIAGGQLNLISSMVTAENIAATLAAAEVPVEFDLLSIDIDRNTYWVWAAMEELRPRAVVIEYNSVFPPGVDWKVEYRADRSWNGSAYFGASLKALELLGRKMGYSLIGCELMGSNAFFVRNDLCADHFVAPFTAENHYEPPRYYLTVRMGHRPGFSDLDE